MRHELPDGKLPPGTDNLREEDVEDTSVKAWLTNGLEVLDALRRQSYDIVLMDVQMPEMNGLDATRRIISSWGADRPWITALTAGAMKENRDECIEAGVDDFLTKPINVQELEAALKRCYDGLHRRSSLPSFVHDPETVEV